MGDDRIRFLIWKDQLVAVMRLHWLGEVQEAESPVRRLGGGGADHVDPANVYLILTHPDRRRLSPPDGHGHGAPISSPELP